MGFVKSVLKMLPVIAAGYIIMRNLENRGPQAGAVRKLTGAA